MSYSFDGKVANQAAKEVNYTTAKCHCSKCDKIIEAPKKKHVSIEDKVFLLQSYLGTENFIYETKSGSAVTYCSKYCRDKHNHRFTK